MREIIKRVTKEFQITKDEAELIIATMLERPRFEIYMNSTLDSELATILLLKLRQLKNGVPIEYITKRVQFMDYPLTIYPGVFIPRVETEYLVECIAQMMDVPPQEILEIGTGCGAVSIVLARIFPEAKITATDISPIAIRNASENIEHLNLKGQITLLRSNLFEGLSARFDLIVSNPPYIPSSRLRFLPKSVMDYEPILAINGGEKGIQFIKRLMCWGEDYLKPQGMMALEIDEDQVEFLTHILNENVSKPFSFKKDLFGRFRYLFIGNFKDEKSKNSN